MMKRQTLYAANMERVMQIRTVGSISAGATTGVVNLTGVGGFALYAVVTVVVTALLVVKTGVRPARYLCKPVSALTAGVAALRACARIHPVPGGAARASLSE